MGAHLTRGRRILRLSAVEELSWCDLAARGGWLPHGWRRGSNRSRRVGKRHAEIRIHVDPGGRRGSGTQVGVGNVGRAGRAQALRQRVRVECLRAAFTGAAGITSAGVAVAGVVVPGWVLAGVPGGRACAGFTFAEAGLRRETCRPASARAACATSAPTRSPFCFGPSRSLPC